MEYVVLQNCGVHMVQRPVHLLDRCTLTKRRYASQSCTMRVHAVPASPRDWEAFFARIPIEEQKGTRYAYDAQEIIGGNLPRCVVLEKLLENHPFGHLIAEWEEGVRGMRPIHVIHHIAYDNGDETSPITKHLGKLGCTHSLYALQGLGTEAKAIELLTGSPDSNCFSVPTWEELLDFTIESFEDGSFEYNWSNADRIHVRNGIIAIPPFMTLALTRANSTDPRVLLMAAVEAIRHVLETDGPQEDKIQQRYRLMELQYIPQWLFLASIRISDDEIREWLDRHICDKRTCWECVKGYSIPDPDSEDNFGIGVQWLDVYDNSSSTSEDDYNLRRSRGYRNAAALLREWQR
jgi:hypothetical protein